MALVRPKSQPTGQTGHIMSDANKIHSVLMASYVPYSAISWGGFNLFGDEASIKEVQRLQSQESRAVALQYEVDELRAALTQDKRHVI